MGGTGMRRGGKRAGAAGAGGTRAGAWLLACHQVVLPLLLGVATGAVLSAQVSTPRAQATTTASSAATTSGVQATTVAIASPTAVAYDSAGNLYVALRDDHVVRRVDTLGVITTVAGTGEQGFSGDGGSAASAQLDTPTGLAFDAAGNLYIADSHNQRVRLVVNGTISTVAGNGIAGFSGDNGNATQAALNLPVAVSVDSAGALYIADSANQRIRKVVSGVISTVAGTGEEGFSGDGGTATLAQLDYPSGIAADPTTAGAFTIGDTRNQRLRTVGADGSIRTVAGTGALAFGGDGGAAVAAALAHPRGLSVNAATGTLYVADTGNQRIRAIAGGQISTVAGNGEQGFAGDLGAATSAVLDSPRGAAMTATGALAVADTHNERVRAVSGSTVTTVAGIAPVAAEGLLLAGPTTGVYRGTIGSLTAVFSNVGKTATGTVTLNDGTTVLGTATLASNTASFDLSGLSAGLHPLSVSYAGDASNAAIASGVYLVNISAAAQILNFPALTNPAAQGAVATLAATASSGLPVTYTVSGPATLSGSTLTYTGGGTVVVTATQAGNANYSAVSASQTITVQATVNQSGTGGFLASAISPSSVPLGATNVQLTVTGTGFTTSSVVQVDGVPQITSFFSATTLIATIPSLTTVATRQVSVYDPTLLQTTAALPLTVSTSSAPVTVTVPATSGSAQQPTIAVQLQQASAVPLAGNFTLTFTPAAGVTVDDPAIQFATGGRAVAFTIPANSTTVPALTLQTGTVAGTITVTLALTAYGVDVTPAAARTSVITIPQQVPSATVTYVQSGSTLTVSVLGYSNVREVSQATFKFKPAAGTTLAQETETLPVTNIFDAGWFATPASTAYGSSFLYTQTFQLGDAGAKIDAVTVTLTNSVGASQPATSP